MNEKKGEDKLFTLKSLDKAWGHIVSLNEGLNIALCRISALEERLAAMEANTDASE